MYKVRGHPMCWRLPLQAEAERREGKEKGEMERGRRKGRREKKRREKEEGKGQGERNITLRIFYRYRNAIFEHFRLRRHFFGAGLPPKFLVASPPFSAGSHREYPPCSER
jgi:hypothetical protein